MSLETNTLSNKQELPVFEKNPANQSQQHVRSTFPLPGTKEASEELREEEAKKAKGRVDKEGDKWPPSTPHMAHVLLFFQPGVGWAGTGGLEWSLIHQLRTIK